MEGGGGMASSVIIEHSYMVNDSFLAASFVA